MVSMDGDLGLLGVILLYLLCSIIIGSCVRAKLFDSNSYLLQYLDMMSLYSEILSRTKFISSFNKFCQMFHSITMQEIF